MKLLEGKSTREKKSLKAHQCGREVVSDPYQIASFREMMRVAGLGKSLFVSISKRSNNREPTIGAWLSLGLRGRLSLSFCLLSSACGF